MSMIQPGKLFEFIEHRDGHYIALLELPQNFEANYKIYKCMWKLYNLEGGWKKVSEYDYLVDKKIIAMFIEEYKWVTDPYLSYQRTFKVLFKGKICMLFVDLHHNQIKCLD